MVEIRIRIRKRNLSRILFALFGWALVYYYIYNPNKIYFGTISGGAIATKVSGANNETTCNEPICGKKIDDDISIDVQLPQPTFNDSCVPTVLASYPGSGSTITRLLIEMATGVYTGSFYRDASLYNGKPYPFRGEFTSDNVIAIKTHYPYYKWSFVHKAKRAIVMIRNPYGAIPSYHNVWWGGQHGNSHGKQAPKEAWENWRQKNVPSEMKRWSEHFIFWIDSGYYLNNTLFIGKYEDLVDKKQGPSTLQRIAQFLDFPSSLQRMEIIWEKSMNISSGIHRPKSYRPQYTPDQAAMIKDELHKLHLQYGTDNAFVAGMLDDYMSSISKYATV